MNSITFGTSPAARVLTDKLSKESSGVRSTVGRVFTTHGQVLHALTAIKDLSARRRCAGLVTKDLMKKGEQSKVPDDIWRYVQNVITARYRATLREWKK